MKKRNFARDTIIVGLALFATMFGAGNLIFPPQIGLFSGSQWVLGALGLLFGGTSCRCWPCGPSTMWVRTPRT